MRIACVTWHTSACRRRRVLSSVKLLAAVLAHDVPPNYSTCMQHAACHTRAAWGSFQAQAAAFLFTFLYSVKWQTSQHVRILVLIMQFVVANLCCSTGNSNNGNISGSNSISSNNSVNCKLNKSKLRTKIIESLNHERQKVAHEHPLHPHLPRRNASCSVIFDKIFMLPLHMYSSYIYSIFIPIDHWQCNKTGYARAVEGIAGPKRYLYTLYACAASMTANLDIFVCMNALISATEEARGTEFELRVLPYHTQLNIILICRYHAYCARKIEN